MGTKTKDRKMVEQKWPYVDKLPAVDEHYLEATTTTTRSHPHFGAIVSLVNNSLFCANVALPGGKIFAAEYFARTLIVRCINADQEKDGRWRHRIRLDYRGRYRCQGVRRGLEFERFDLFQEANFQHIFRSSLVWTVGYFRTAERDADMRKSPGAE